MNEVTSSSFHSFAALNPGRLAAGLAAYMEMHK